MDFCLKITKDFQELSVSDVIPGVVEYEDGNYVYHKHSDDKKTYEQIPTDRYVVRANLGSELDKLRTRGLEAVSNGQLCAIVLCGGQATRLGADRPKGTFDLGLKGDLKTLLQLQAAQIVRLQNVAQSLYPKTEPKVPWYVMVSKSTHSAVEEHLREICNEFGLRWMDDVVIFEQKEIPAFDFEGNRFKQEDGSDFLAPNGNGGIYDSLKPLLGDLEQRGVKYIHAYCVDNVLCRVGDPVFLGAAIEKQADCAAKVVEKKEPGEKVGVICLEKGKPTVVEYSELPEELAKERTSEGQLKYRAGSIANHIFTLDFLNTACSLHLPYHIAKKKVPFFDSKEKRTIKPSEVNGIKLERFIFDVFQASKNFLVYQVERSEEFSPLKNPDSAGSDCPSTCRRDLKLLHQKWLLAAGVPERDAQKIELISPLMSYEGEGLDPMEIARFLQLKKYLVVSENTK